MTAPIFFLKNIELTFGGKPLFSDVNLQINKGEKICLIGRNGSGKSTLLKVIAGVIDFDNGERFLQPSNKISYLLQDNDNNEDINIYDYILETIDNHSHKEENLYKIDIILYNLDLDGNDRMKNLSGGKLRRASLAKTLIAEPDILLLDEPTNHLDIISIEWLENYVKDYKGALICISHDKQFLRNISKKIFWLDRGCVKTLDKNFSAFEDWSNQQYDLELSQLHKLNKKLSKENLWLQQGVTARRKRNQGRLKDLYQIREKLKNDRNELNKYSKSVNFQKIDELSASKLVIDINNISFSFNELNKPIIDRFSAKIQKGEKIALIGRNACGKTTLIKLITGELDLNQGKIKIGKNIKISYFDQKRESLDQNKTIYETIFTIAGESILVNGKYKHINSYLKDFLFDDNQFHSPVSSLSGGESNRLLLATILTNPGDLLILDEPTNDLDIETLDLLEEMIADYKGTVLIVSHDREFLDKIVTRSLVFDNGKIVDCIGGYSDYNTSIVKEKKERPVQDTAKIFQKTNKSSKLSYKIVHELGSLPTKIEKLESEIRDLENDISDPNLYEENKLEFDNKIKILSNKKIELEQYENRWLELEEMNNQHS